MQDTQTLQLVLTAVAVGTLLVQTIFLIVLAVMARKALKTVQDELTEYRAVVIPMIDSARPIIDKTRRIVDDLAPKVEEISGQLTTISKSLREQTADIQVATSDIIGRTRRQANRVDNIMTSVLNRVEHAGTIVSDAVAKPMRQISGLVASVKAAVDALREPPARVQPPSPRVVPTRYSDGDQVPGPRPTGTTSPFHP